MKREIFCVLALLASLSAPVYGASITVDPNPCSVRAGATQAFYVSTSGLASSAVSWSVNGVQGGNNTVGTINTSGLYTAPPTIALGSVTITATSTTVPGVSGSCAASLLNPSPWINYLDPSGINTGNFTEIVTGNNFVPGATATLGTSNLSVSYMSPTQIKVSGSTSLAAGAAANLTVTNPNPGSSSYSKSFTIQPPVALTIAPNTPLSVLVGNTTTFNRAITNISETGVTWSVNGILGGNSTVGTITGINSYQATYTAPASVPSNATVNITAASQWYPSIVSSPTPVTIYGPSLTITPSTASVRAAGAAIDFGVQTVGLSANTVTWSVNGVVGGNATVGTIDGNGIYNSPPTIALGTVTIGAKSTVNSSVSNTAAVTLLNPGPWLNYIDPTGFNSGNFVVILNGNNFVPGVTATLNGSNLTTTYMSATQVKVAGSTAQQAGSQVTLTVTNPNPGSSSTSQTYSLLAPVTMSISANNTTALVGTPLTFTRVINNISETAVNWYVNGVLGGNSSVGTITPINGWSATYTAPSSVPNGGTVNVTAGSQWLSSVTSPPVTVTITGPSISVNPATTSVRAAGGTTGFGVTTQALSSNSVKWSVNGVSGGNATVGTIDSNGNYTAPPTIALGTVTVTATSTVNANVSGSAVVTLWNPTPSISASDPTRPNTGNYRINVLGYNFVPGTTASLGGVGMNCSYVSATEVDCTGSTTLPANSTTTLTVTNPNPGSVSSSASRTVNPPVTVSLTSNSTSLPCYQTLQIYSTVANTTETGVIWSVNGTKGGNSSIGTITDNGDGSATYTAPASVPSAQIVNITGASAWYPTIVSPALPISILNPTPAITSVSPNPVPIGTFTVTVTGSNFVNGSVVNFNGASLTTTYVSATQVKATGTATPTVGNYAAITVSNPNPGASVSNPQGVPLYEPNALVTYQAAVRFLSQASWGGTPADVDNVQKLGFQGWLNQQQKVTPSVFPAETVMSAFQEDWFNFALTGQDQLRQRVAWALSEILVTGIHNMQVPAMTTYAQLLNTDALGFYNNLLSQMTVNPTMGTYLNMANNLPANVNNGTLPNENYAREVMQLFSIGMVMLNNDGTPQLDGSGNQIPTYTEDTIQNLSRVFTGWTYATVPGAQALPQNPQYYGAPMMPVDADHDMGSKTIVGGIVLPAGQNTQTDMNAAMKALFNHPDVGPFLSKQLIQHLVSSNPTPAYISRVASVFNADSYGYRGNLWAVVQAILLDPEARQNDNTSTPLVAGGHLREPVLYMTSLCRALNVQVTDLWRPLVWSQNFGQDPFNPESVFSYFPPTYALPGGNGLLGPEFAILTFPAVVNRVNFVDQLLRQVIPNMTVDLSPFTNLYGDPQSMVNAAGYALLGAPAPSQISSAILPVMALTTTPTKQAQYAIYLTAGSGFFQVLP